MSAYFKTYIYFVILIENHDVSLSTCSFFFLSVVSIGNIPYTVRSMCLSFPLESKLFYVCNPIFFECSRSQILKWQVAIPCG